MIIEKASKQDINTIVDLTKQTREYFRNNNIPQWQNAYPNYETFKEDVELERLYVIKEANELAGFFALVYPDPNYDYIEGNWLNDLEYIAIHRMAIKEKFKRLGYASKVFDFVKSKYNNIRIDTHADNLPMNKAIIKNDFIFCGIVYMSDKTARNAYQWTKKIPK